MLVPVVSSRKQQANRANAKRSTGPRTAEGKARVSHNALGYGLAIPVTANPAFQAEIDQLAQAILLICGPGANLELATRVAEAQVDLNRVRSARHHLISCTLQEPPSADKTQLVLSRERDNVSLRKLLSSRSNCLQIMHELSKGQARDAPAESPEEREAHVLDGIAKELNALERYESRALSRRKLAVRAFDDAFSQPTETSAAPFKSPIGRDRP